jgi:hypothetical protein
MDSTNDTHERRAGERRGEEVNGKERPLSLLL